MHGAVGFTWDCDAAVLLQAGQAERHAARLPGLAAPAGRRPRARRRAADDPTGPDRRDGRERSTVDAVRRARARRRRAAPRRRAHTLERRGARGRAAVVGPRPALHARDAEPVEPRARCSSGAGSSSRSSPATRATRSRTSPRTRGSSGRYQSGAVEVEHWSFLAFAQRLEAAAQGLPAIATRSIAGSSMADERRLRRGRRRRSAPSVSSRRSQPDVAILHAPVADRAGNVAVAPAAARRGVGCARRAPGRDRHRGARRRRSLARALGPRAHPGAPRARGLRGADGRAPRRAVRPGPAGRRLRRGLRLLGRGPRRDPARRLRRLDPPLGPRAGRPGRVPRAPRRRARRRAAGQGGARRPWQLDAAEHPPDLDAPVERLGDARRRSARATSPNGSTRSGAHAVLAGAGVANLAAWLGVRRAPRDRAATCSSPRRSGCGATSRRSATRSC